jgi:hypothetical protein
LDGFVRGLAVFERYRFSLYDSMLVATALISGAKILYSEDLQHGQNIDNQLRVTDPIRDRRLQLAYRQAVTGPLPAMVEQGSRVQVLLLCEINSIGDSVAAVIALPWAVLE